MGLRGFGVGRGAEGLVNGHSKERTSSELSRSRESEGRGFALMQSAVWGCIGRSEKLDGVLNLKLSSTF